MKTGLSRRDSNLEYCRAARVEMVMSKARDHGLAGDRCRSLGQDRVIVDPDWQHDWRVWLHVERSDGGRGPVDTARLDPMMRPHCHHLLRRSVHPRG
jgi:hypothetical protein